ncbi:MAG: hypothetical protein AB1486_34095 [Planctomycetota bacterium]
MGTSPEVAIPGEAEPADSPTPESVPGTIPTTQPSGRQPGHGTVRLVGGQAYEAMDRQMTKAARGGDVCRRVLAFNLAEMEKRKLPRGGAAPNQGQIQPCRPLRHDL